MYWRKFPDGYSIKLDNYLFAHMIWMTFQSPVVRHSWKFSWEPTGAEDLDSMWEGHFDLRPEGT